MFELTFVGGIPNWALNEFKSEFGRNPNRNFDSYERAAQEAHDVFAQRRDLIGTWNRMAIIYGPGCGGSGRTINGN